VQTPLRTEVSGKENRDTWLTPEYVANKMLEIITQTQREVYLKSHSINLKDIEKLLVLKTWYASLFVLPLANRLTVFFANNQLTPNQITLPCALY